MSKIALLAFFIAVLLAAGCGKAMPSASAYDAEVATAWFDLYLLLVEETEGFTPPVASRAFGYAGVTLYEAVAPGIPTHQSLAGQLTDLPPLPQPAPDAQYHWPTVANSALAVITRRLFPNASGGHKGAMSQLEERLNNEFKSSVDTAVFTRSVAQGQAVANAVYDWSRGDGGAQGYLTNFPDDYAPPTGPGMWVPTARKADRGWWRPPLKAPHPYWGNNRRFVPTSGGECDPGPPPAYSEEPGSAFYDEAREVYETVRNITPEQNQVALFWGDDPGKTATPPGHSVSILTQVIKQKGSRLDVAAEAYAKVGIAVADAFIGCWKTKYEYNLVRPITYIQKVIDPTWNTTAVTDPIDTPPFPEYTSGHSVQSGAAAQVLTDMFGETAFADHTHDIHAKAPRSFSSFFAFADEAAISRLYGGIHFRAGIERGVKQGKCIGKRVSALKFRKAS